MQLTFLGVRGSTSAPGPEFVRYGGHTSCVAITPRGSARPSFVLDAGTGLRTLTTLLDGQPFRGSIVLSHLHWDHVQGLPFFVAGDRSGAQVTVYVPAQDGTSGRDLLAQAMSPPAFPITPDGLQGDWSFEALDPGVHLIEGLSVTAAEVRHKGGRTFGYRVSDGHVDIAYVPDHVAVGEITSGLDSIVRGVDLLLHDAQFVESERLLADAYGHSTVGDALNLAERLEVRALGLVHHGPARSDDQLDEIGADLDVTFPVVVVREGQVVTVERAGLVVRPK
ncbi:MAG: MBL fold metallo-hydrolase [Actinomycetes bacterium]